MKRFNIVTRGRGYTGSDGKQKYEWNQIGKAVYFPESGDKEAGLIVELNTMPGRSEYNERLGKETWINPVVTFLQAPKEGSKPKVETTGYDGPLYGGEITDADLPFGR